jgi:hypothetical protein
MCIASSGLLNIYIICSLQHTVKHLTAISSALSTIYGEPLCSVKNALMDASSSLQIFCNNPSVLYITKYLMESVQYTVKDVFNIIPSKLSKIYDTDEFKCAALSGE